MAATSKVAVLASLLPVQDPVTRGQHCTTLGTFAHAASCLPLELPPADHEALPAGSRS